MPELPEVETMRLGILPIIGATVVRAQRTPCLKRPIEIKPRIDRLNKRVAGKKISAIERLGKRVVVRFETGDRLVFEPRMTGLVLLEEPPTHEHLRFSLELKNGPHKRLLFWDRRGLGNVTLLSPAQYREKLESGTLGPDALDVSRDDFRQRFKNTKREIKIALLDQAAIAGVGNLYASEILHAARVSPRLRCHRLSKSQWYEVYDRMVEILERAIKYEGSTLSDGTYRNALNQTGSFQDEHQVYDREGKLCPNCQESEIKRIVQAQRSTFFCSKCQRSSVARRHA